MSREIINNVYDFAALPTQKKLLDAVGAMQTPNICYCGGFGSGKSRIGGEVGLELAVTYSGLRVGIFRKTRVSIVDTTYDTFLQEVLPPEFIKKGGWNKSSLRIILRNSSQFQFFGIDQFEKKGSLKFDVIIIDEGIELTANDLVMLEGRLRAKVIPLPMLIILTNAGAPGHIIHEKFVKNHKLPYEKRDKDYLYLSANSFENVNNPEAYFDRLRKWEGSQYYARFVLSQWTGFEGVILGCFDPEFHVVEPFPIPHTWEKRVVFDFGYEHACAVFWYARDPVNNIDYLYRQFYHTRKLLREIIPFCKKISEDAGEYIFEIICDHDAESRAQVEEDWMSTTPARKSVSVGIQRMIDRFLPRETDYHSGIYIFNDTWDEREKHWYGLLERDLLLQEKDEPCCFQEEVPFYVWGKDDQPIKKFDHGHDNVRYYINTMDYNSKGSQHITTNIGAAARR